MAWVWKHSRSVPTQRLVLLAIADCANDVGAEAYPSTDTLATKTGLSDRGVRKAVAGLVALGELRVEYKTGPKGCNRYRVIMADPEQGAGNPEQGAASEDTRNTVHPEPRSASTRNHVPGTRNETTVDPERGSPEPSDNHPPTEPSLEPSASATASPTRRARKPKPPPDPDRADVDRICTHLAGKIEANGSKRPRITSTWRTDARLLLDMDGRTADQVIRAIDWCQADPFWRGNVLSMSALRKQYDRLRLAAQRGVGARASPPTLVDVGGLKLKPETAARLNDRSRIAAMDAANEQLSIEGVA